MLTADELHEIMPFAHARVEEFCQPLNDAMREFDISTPLREAAFIAQVAHESGELRYTQEIADGQAYEGRADLGNTQPGDGPRFKGRGLLQITGRANYLACGAALGLDLVSDPGQLTQPVAACRSAGWFWQTRGLNELADGSNTLLITRRINGGLNGYDDRMRYYRRALAALGDDQE